MPPYNLIIEKKDDKMKTFTVDVECYSQPMVCRLWDAKLVFS